MVSVTIATDFTFDDFIEWYPENSTTRYELHDGEIVEMPNPTGKHSKVAGFLSGNLFLEIMRLQLPYFIPTECVVRSTDERSGYKPDVIVLDENAIADDPRWDKESVITQGSSVRLIVEVVSTNWADDYARKLEEYESLGIAEYWIVDYLGLGGKRFIGSPKMPTVSVYQLIDGEYQVKQFRGSERIESPTFSELTLTVEQLVQAGA
ncbi:Uma2 family endonuclease [Leptolyngbya boryana CZ1]|uniref:Uma2 family endonuclease n=1 Tax=Leptolyngbya boryana CZ1 TaxID=3060204 RepID=A0AA96WXF7_LEPBY|nr:Uma2 family endonuclease [Leptolyngbya boryana]WNZ47352.1 Uma2 family endonuclease [Leptolyngbya boryana CZ1]